MISNAVQLSGVHEVSTTALRSAIDNSGDTLRPANLQGLGSLLKSQATPPRPVLAHTSILQLILSNPLEIIHNASQGKEIPTKIQVLEAAARTANLDQTLKPFVNGVVTVFPSYEAAHIPEGVATRITVLTKELDNAQTISAMVDLLSNFHISLTGAELSNGLGIGITYATNMLIDGSKFGIYGPEAYADYNPGIAISVPIPPPILTFS